MKRTKMFLGGGGFILGLLLLWIFIISIKDWRNNGDLMLKNQIEKTGRIIAHALKEKNAFPRDYIYSDVNQTISPIEEWYDQIKIKDIITTNGSIKGKVAQKICFDPSVWTVIKNLPDNPPENIIVLATRNVAPESLRTRVNIDDMNKVIKFKNDNDVFRIFRRFAILVDASGRSITIPVTSSPDRLTKITYETIYRNMEFDITTNLVYGLKVKYLTPCGEITPLND